MKIRIIDRQAGLNASSQNPWTVDKADLTATGCGWWDVMPNAKMTVQPTK